MVGRAGAGGSSTSVEAEAFPAPSRFFIFCDLQFERDNRGGC
jgi:hypothetical protein